MPDSDAPSATRSTSAPWPRSSAVGCIYSILLQIERILHGTKFLHPTGLQVESGVWRPRIQSHESRPHVVSFV
jgi:hypothetical protein